MRFIKGLADPVFIIIVLLGVAFSRLIVKKCGAFVKWALGAGLILFFLLSMRPFSNSLLWSLECEYPPLYDFWNLQGIHYVVVLTAWDSDNQTVPYTSNVGYRSSLRVLEAHRIYRELSHCKIIVSGSKVGGRLMGKLLCLLGVAEEEIITDHSENTRKSAENIRKILYGQDFVLVTSAIHLPRAMDCFINSGLRPIAAPADFQYGYYKTFRVPLKKRLSYYLPNGDSFRKSGLVIYEYIGMFWYSISGRGKE